MDAIALSFTLKDQNIGDISDAVKSLKEKVGTVELIHAFMPRQVVLEKEFDPAVVDLLDATFPVQTSFYGEDGPDREGMAKYAKEKKAIVYLIGEIRDGVAEEVDLYSKAGLEISPIALPQRFPASDKTISGDAPSGEKVNGEAVGGSNAGEGDEEFVSRVNEERLKTEESEGVGNGTPPPDKSTEKDNGEVATGTTVQEGSVNAESTLSEKPAE